MSLPVRNIARPIVKTAARPAGRGITGGSSGGPPPGFMVLKDSVPRVLYSSAGKTYYSHK